MRSAAPLLSLAVVACAATPTPVAAPAPARLTFIEDDYPRALAEARASQRPLFVDAWAPW